MKKIFTVLATALMSVTVSFAQQTVFIGETGYDSLQKAFDAAQSGDVITLTGDQVMTERLGISGKAITITADPNADIKIIRDGGNKTNTMFLVNGNGKIDLENVTIDGKNVTCTNTTLEAAQSGDTFNLKNVKFVDCISSNGAGLFKMKGHTILDNVTIENCQMAEGRGDFFVGGGNVTLTGNGNYSLYIEKSLTVTADNFTGHCPIYLENISAGRTIVKQGSAANFTFANAPEGFNFITDKGNVVITSSIPVMTNEATGEIFTSFESAKNTCTQPDNTLILTDNCDISDRFMPNAHCNVTIKGKTGNEVLRSTFGGKLFMGVENATLTLEDLILDCNFEGNDKPELEAGTKGKLVLRNVQIINSKTDNHLINVKDNSSLTVTNLRIDNCTDNAIYLNQNSKLYLSGNNNFAIICKYANETITALEDGIDHKNNMIYITYEDPLQLVEDQLIVSNCTHGTRFRITNRRPEVEQPANDEPTSNDEGEFLLAPRKVATYAETMEDLYPLKEQHYLLYSRDNKHLYLTTNVETGIGKVESEEAGKVNVIDFAGRVIRRNVDSNTALEGLPAGMYIVGKRKVVVR